MPMVELNLTLALGLMPSVRCSVKAMVTRERGRGLWPEQQARHVHHAGRRANQLYPTTFIWVS